MPDALALRRGVRPALFPFGRGVSMDVLYIDEGFLIITGAGTAAGIDACLHLVRRELGSAVATRIARRMVVPPQRDGGQRQYVEAPLPEGGRAARASSRCSTTDPREPLRAPQPIRTWPAWQ